jgi:enoyl-CoA hydratase
MLRSETRDGVAILSLSRGPANALTTEFLNAIAAEVDRLRREPPHGLVLTGTGKIFSAGLDLKEVLDYDRPAMAALLDALNRACLGLFRFPRRVVCALNGHAFAGGALLSLACDTRLLERRDTRWAMNEIRLGLLVPPIVVEIARHALPRSALDTVITSGQALGADEAARMGVLDLIPVGGDVVAAAVAAARTESPEVFATLKSWLHAPAEETFARARENDALWLDSWFREESQARLRAALAAVARR